MSFPTASSSGLCGRLGRRTVLVVASLLAFSLLSPLHFGGLRGDEGATFRRGDANLDGRVSLADVVAVLRYVAFGGSLWCVDAADADDSGNINSTDALFLLGSLFYGHGFPPPPFVSPGVDPTPDDLGCARSRPPGVAALGGAGGGEALAEEDGEVEPQDCDGPHTGGSDLDFIYMHKGYGSVAPGESRVRIPIQVRSVFGGLEGISISVYVPPEHVHLQSIEFVGGLLAKLPEPPAWNHVLTGRREEGYLATSLVLSFQPPFRTLPPIPALEPLAYLVLSVDADAPLGELIPISFRSTPATPTSMAVDNEISRGGETQALNLCGLFLRVVRPGEVFIRGDANWDRKLNLSDPILILRYLFYGEATSIPCEDAADFDDDGRIALTDAIESITYLFQRGAAPASPFPDAGYDVGQDSLDCAP